MARTTVKPLVGEANWRRLRLRLGPAVGSTARPGSPLSNLAARFGSDKWGSHYYTPHYERHLGHLRRERFTLLEIGIGGYADSHRGGASLRMWRAYFPRALVVGLDLEDKSFLDGDRIRTYRGSQTDADLLRGIVAEVGQPRVAIDDGSHRPEHVRATFATLFPLLDDFGIYVIEDTQTSYWPEFGGSEDRHDRTTTVALVKDLLDGLNFEEFIDESYEPTETDRSVVAVHAYHNLVVIEKGHNAEGSNRRRILRKRYASEGKRTPR